MPLNASVPGNIDGLVLNPVYTGLVNSYGPSDIGLSANELFPRIPFTSAGNGMGYLTRYNISENFQAIPDEQLQRRPGAAALKVNHLPRNEVFSVSPRHLDAVVPDAHAKLVRQQTGGKEDPNATEVKWVWDKLLLGKEQRAAAALADSANFATEITPAQKWDDYANGDPIADIQSAMLAVRNASGLIPNTVALPWEVALRMSYHPRFRIATPTGGSVRSTNERDVVTAEGVAELLKAILSLDKVVILKSVVQAAAIRRDPTLDLTNIWGKHAYVYYSPREAKLTTLIWGADPVDTFYYGGDKAGVFSFYDQNTESMIHRVREDSDIKIFNPGIAVALRNVIN